VITDWPRLTNVIGIRNFLDLAGYHLRFIKEFSKTTFALTNLLKKATKFEWIEKCERVFQELRQCLTTVPIPTLPVQGEE